MAQLVTRIDDELAAAIDRLVDQGVVRSRSDAVRRGLAVLLDEARRAAIGEAIVAAYERVPQTDDELGWTDTATAAMIAEEPW